MSYIRLFEDSQCIEHNFPPCTVLRRIRLTAYAHEPTLAAVFLWDAPWRSKFALKSVGAIGCILAVHTLSGAPWLVLTSRSASRLADREPDRLAACQRLILRSAACPRGHVICLLSPSKDIQTLPSRSNCSHAVIRSRLQQEKDLCIPLSPGIFAHPFYNAKRPPKLFHQQLLCPKAHPTPAESALSS
ncbi:hypothetical protein BU16DRAFT_147836 [Lophium mytilinum]|uniref:Uncharacterized protein n=1 Tax=Lophium mytilinum TaxID=390894 RepID=A0A6A6QE12_9PEZI|nr:hypothetical protein BU16DRAFT_147836 [Lophium mytilinum]